MSRVAWDTRGVEIADEATHRGLAYIAATSRHGYKLSVAEFEAFMSRPMGRADLIGALGHSVMEATREPPSIYLARVKWAGILGDTIALTKLGEAVLAALDAGDPGDVLSIVPLKADDSFAYRNLSTTLRNFPTELLIHPLPVLWLVDPHGGRDLRRSRWLPDEPLGMGEIGRASCRERV